MLTSSDRRLSCSMDGTVLPDRKVNRHLQPVDLCFHDFLHLKQSCNRKSKENARTQCIRDYASRSHKSPSRYLGMHYFVLGSYSFFFILFEEHFKVHLQRSVIGYTTLPSVALHGGWPLLHCPPQTSVSYPYLLQILVFMHILFAHFFTCFLLTSKLCK